MDIILTSQGWLSVVFIFALRTADMTLDTLRTLFVIRGSKLPAWIVGFFQALIFVIALGAVLQGLDNPLNIIAYAAGFATGNVVGMLIEERLAIGYTNIRIVSSRRGAAITEELRLEGFAVTEVPARGKDGTVSLLDCSVRRKDVDQVGRIVRAVDEQAFITAEDVRPVRRGFWRA